MPSTWKEYMDRAMNEVKPSGVADKHQLKIARKTKPIDRCFINLKIAIDTVKNPAKGMMGGPSAEEAEKTLRNKFGYTDTQIAKLKK